MKTVEQQPSGSAIEPVQEALSESEAPFDAGSISCATGLIELQQLRTLQLLTQNPTSFRSRSVRSCRTSLKSTEKDHQSIWAMILNPKIQYTTRL